MPLRLTLTSADALAVALSHIRPALRLLGPDAVAEIDGPRFTIHGSLPGAVEAEPAPVPTLIPSTTIEAEEVNDPDPVEALVARVLAEPDPMETAADLADAFVDLAPDLDAESFRVAVVETAPSIPAVYPGKVWTGEDDQRLLELRRDGLSHKEIGERMGRSVKSIDIRVGKLRKAGLDLEHRAGRGIDPSVVERIKREREAGKTFPEIGAEMGLSGLAARMRLKRAEEATPQPPAPVEPEPGFRTMRGVTFHAIPPSPLVAVTEAIREVKGADKPVLGRLPAIEPARSTKPGTSDLRRKIAAHLDAVGHDGRWTPARDLDLVEGICAGNIVATHRRLGLTKDAAVERFKLLCQPIRDPRKGNSPEGQIVLVELLRERAAKPSTVAAE